VTLLRNCRILAAAAILAIAPCAAGAQAVSPIDYGSGAIADARLGVALATMSELADAPALLGRPSSQQFVDDAFARVQTIAGADSDVRSHVTRWRDTLRPDAAGYNRNAAYAAAGDLTKALLRAVGSPRDHLISLGVLAEQVSYNARVLHDPGIDDGDRAAIGADDAADALAPGLKDVRAEIASIASKRWTAAATSAGKLVSALLGSSFGTPFPPSNRVWLVLLRVRPTTADTARRAEHYWLDVVRFDGTHQTIGGYPNDTTDYAHDARRLLCGFNKELDETSDRIIPIAPGAGTTSEQLAAALVRLCNDQRVSGLRYHVRDADDDKMIADLVFRAGVLVGPILKAAASR